MANVVQALWRSENRHDACCVVARKVVWFVAVAVAYGAAGRFTPTFASLYGEAAAVSLAAGLVFAVVATWGWRALPPLLVGAWAAGIAAGQSPDVLLASTVLEAAVIAGMVRVPLDALRLERTREIVRRLLVPAGLASLVAALPAALVALLQGDVGAASFLLLARAAADLTGMALLGPVALTLFGQPRHRWAALRPTVGLPLALATALLIALLCAIGRSDSERMQAAFDNDARAVIARVESRLRGVMDTIDSLHGSLWRVDGQVTPKQFEALLQPRLHNTAGVVGTGWHERVARAEAVAFEASVEPALELCVIDMGPDAAVRRLAGPADCERRPRDTTGLRRVDTIEFAGRHWEIHASRPLTSAIHSGGHWNVWLYVGPALIGALLLVMLLLTITGQAQCELRERLHAERVRDQAEAACRAKSELIARVSHEMRTPLNAIVGFTELLDSVGTALEPGRRKWVSCIQHAGSHLLAVVNDLLDASRIESARLQSQPLLLTELIDGCVEMVAQGAVQRGITIDSRIADDAQAVVGDPLRLRQVLINLMANAVKYNRDGGSVIVQTHAVDLDAVSIEVSDTGWGMTAEQLDALFQPFNRLGREGAGVEGSGIGLVITKRLAEQMGGSLYARSVAGHGSTFTLALPAGPVQSSRSVASGADAGL